MENERLQKQLEFLVEIDKMKSIFRQTLLVDKSRRENDAEHSWHFAIMAIILHEYAKDKDVNITRVIRMALIHDLVEIYAGDTFAYDDAGNENKEEREKASAQRLFALLPDDQAYEIRELWEEFDHEETADAKYAAAIDRFQPLLNNHMTGGHTWKLGNVTSDKVYRRMEPIRESIPELWDFVEFIIHDAIEKGYLQETPVS